MQNRELRSQVGQLSSQISVAAAAPPAGPSAEAVAKMEVRVAAIPLAHVLRFQWGCSCTLRSADVFPGDTIDNELTVGLQLEMASMHLLYA